MNLDRIYTEWQATHRTNPVQAHALVADASKTILSVDNATLSWMVASLSDEQRKFFVAALFTEAQAMPEALYQPMLRAAVDETSPIRVQAFIEPCVKAFGVKRVSQTLIDYIEKGDNFEKAGAVNALHWTSQRKGTAESGRHSPVDVEMMGLNDYRRALFLKTFIDNADLEVRRSLITNADLDTYTANGAIKELIDKVVKIARAHPDEYIRHRVEVQLGRSPSAYPLPARKRPNEHTVSKKKWWKQIWK